MTTHDHKMVKKHTLSNLVLKKYFFQSVNLSEFAFNQQNSKLFKKRITILRSEMYGSSKAF